jgi:hypothetical protein
MTFQQHRRQGLAGMALMAGLLGMPVAATPTAPNPDPLPLGPVAHVVPGAVAHRVGTLTLVCPTRPMPWAAYPPASCRVIIATPIR